MHSKRDAIALRVDLDCISNPNVLKIPVKIDAGFNDVKAPAVKVQMGAESRTLDYSQMVKQDKCAKEEV